MDSREEEEEEEENENNSSKLNNADSNANKIKKKETFRDFVMKNTKLKNLSQNFKLKKNINSRSKYNL